MRFLLMSNINARCLAFAFASHSLCGLSSISVQYVTAGGQWWGGEGECWSCDRTFASACIAFDMRRAIAIADLCLSHKQIALSQQQQQQSRAEQSRAGSNSSRNSCHIL